MAKRLGTAMIGPTGGLAVCAISAVVALASIPERPNDANEIAGMTYGEEAGLTRPIDGAPFFAAADPQCVGDLAVINHLDAERTRLGGEMVMLADGLDQDFADEWRRQVDGQRVEVSGVFAHVFGDADSAMVDVIELDADGCALSRTLLTGDDWHFLLSRAVGVEV